MTDPAPCLACHGTGMKAVDADWNRTCKHCFGTGHAAPIFDRSAPHAIDHAAYADGVARPERMLALEAADPFWKTLGGNPADPWGDQGETMRQRAKALSMGLGRAIYLPMIGHPRSSADYPMPCKPESPEFTG